MKWVKCTYKELMQFVEDNKLIRRNDFMHTFWDDENGVEKARSMHGFACDEYSIFTLENVETLQVVDKIINR